MKDKPIVSVIIPMYNCEKFIYKTLINLKKQDYQNFEVILVDDGSSDSTVEEVKKVTDTFYDMNLFTKKNGGVSSARNHGLKQAKGDFIMFLDSDDYYPHNYISKMLEKQKEFPRHMILAAINNVDEKGKVLFTYPMKKTKNVILSKYELFKTIVEIGGYGGFVLNKLFSREIIERNNILFKEDIHFCEDQLFAMQYVNFVEGAAVSKSISYCRLIHTESFVQSRKNSQKFNPKWESYFVAKAELEKIVEKQDNLSEKEREKLKKINLLSWRNEYLFLKKLAIKFGYSSNILKRTRINLSDRNAFSFKLDIHNAILKNYSLKDLVKSILFRIF